MEDLASKIRKFLDAPEIKCSRGEVAFVLTQNRGYDEKYSWELAGLLVEQYLDTMFKGTSAKIEDVFKYATKPDLGKEILEWVNER